MIKLMLFIVIPSIALARLQDPVVYPVRTISPPIIDGRLDDPCWLLCNPVTDFYMIEPNPGAPVTQTTVVYVCYNDEKLFFGIHMSEDKPDALQATVTQRDGGVYMDDSFELMLDTYCDRRNAYYFMSNLLGAKLDGRIIDNGRSVDQTWDAHWETKSHCVEDGWEMEIAIPFSELTFSLSDTLIWGVNFWRIERPNWENTSFSPIQRWNQVSKYGTLTDISIEPKIKRFEVLPYGAFRYDQDSLHFRGGIDFEYDITPDLILNAAFWPDFAQIEADPFKFNLSYEQGEELYFPEKRPFFLEGSSILSTPIQLFYTRRINEILVGGKLYGKIKSTELLVLDAETEDTKENFSVLRIKQDIFATTTLGALVTHKQRSDTISQAASLDLSHPLYGPFLLTSQICATNNSSVPGDQWAAHIGIEGETSTYGGGVFAERFGSNFRVEQGFIDIYDINKQGVSGYAWKKLLCDKGISKWLEVGGEIDVTQEIGDRIASVESEVFSNFVMTNKWRIGFTGIRDYERYGDNEFINTGISFSIESNVGGMTGIASYFKFGNLYNQSFRMFHFGFLIQPIQKITVFPYFQTIRWGQTKWQWLTNTRISCKITDQAFFRIFLQADSEEGTETEKVFNLEVIQNLNLNFLFGYEFAPGTILYFVYNQPRNFSEETINNIFVAKFTYSFQF